MDNETNLDEDEVESDEENEELEVEDDGAGLLYDYDTFIQKLREKPTIPTEKGCGASAPAKSYQDFEGIPTANRLSVPTLSSLDSVRRRFPYPKEAVPPLALPSWHLLSLDKKIPFLQAGRDVFYYHRGKLGQKLHRWRPPTFNTKDPNNYERVVGGSYNMLHDPHAQNLLYSPPMLAYLFKQGYINEENEVLCSLQEFNKFRDYLRTIYNDRISGDLAESDAFTKSEREQLRALRKAESSFSAEGRDAKVAARIKGAKEYHEALLELKRHRQHQRDEMDEARLMEWRENKERMLMTQILRGIENNNFQRERLRVLEELRQQERRDNLAKTARKFLETEERKANDKAMMKAAYNTFLLEWIQSKFAFCYDKILEKKQIQDDVKGEIKYKARKRQVRLEHYREQLPSMLEKRKAEEERIWAIVRKYAMRWLEKVRKRLNAPKDEKHESSWFGQGKSVLDETVRYLRQESGYEKLDDFILNIMKLKKQIQMQIELEEAEEAALAALAAQEEEGGSEGDDEEVE